MRRSAATKLRAVFRSAMHERIPAFEHEPATHASLDLYVCDLSAVRFYVLLQLHEMRDAFTIEIGWSEQRRAPARIAFLMLPSDEPVNGEQCFRLRRLSRGEHDDEWWELVPPPSGWPFSEENLVDLEARLEGGELEERARHIAVEAVAEIVEYAVPYFRRIAADHEISPPLAWPLQARSDY
ncbi:MAG TPA: hypothetical protein VGC00_08175 [Thermoanaerobaculia bacterium]